MESQRVDFGRRQKKQQAWYFSYIKYIEEYMCSDLNFDTFYNNMFFQLFTDFNFIDTRETMYLILLKNRLNNGLEMSILAIYTGFNDKVEYGTELGLSALHVSKDFLSEWYASFDSYYVIN